MQLFCSVICMAWLAYVTFGATENATTDLNSPYFTSPPPVRNETPLNTSGGSPNSSSINQVQLAEVTNQTYKSTPPNILNATTQGKRTQSLTPSLSVKAYTSATKTTIASSSSTTRSWSPLLALLPAVVVILLNELN
uniref:Membrane protein m119.3 n=1 Tax=Mastomys natalensis cytomegalovirus 1 TaxID=2973541 RepID=A0A9Y1ILI4_9BETA|nr:membrane protein m119.3 [Mastomys natalensis cytomegalovirus 1]WEG68971.1 membrane protein m119.3 [Mastomys natalensis cytomegalovirus 1]WEG71199.1 membrane protein m119.3 [Mastomys natalensis cytomegalovirus 1]